MARISRSSPQGALRHGKYRWDFVQIQLNYVDWRHAYETNKRNQDAIYLYGECEKRGIPVVVMEPLLGGRLARFNYTLAEKLIPLDPEATLAKWAFRFAGHHPKVMTVLSGMTYREHLEERRPFRAGRTLSPRCPRSGA